MNNKSLYRKGKYFSCLLVFTFISVLQSCSNRPLLDKLTIHENPFVKLTSKPEVLLDNLNNPAAPFFSDDRIIFVEGGKGTLYEYKDKKTTLLIEGFGLDSYGGYPISVLGLTSVPDKGIWIVAASQDVGHILVFDESTFPTTADKGREIEFLRTEPSNPFGVILVQNGSLLVASGGTKSAYQGFFDVINPSPLLPIFDIPTGVEGLAEDPRNGNIFGAVVGTGLNDGYLIRWDPIAETIKPHTVAEGFNNLVEVAFLPNRLLLLLEFGEFGAANTGQLLVIDPDNPKNIYPVISGLDSPSGFALAPDNTLLITTFGDSQKVPNGMLIRLKLSSKIAEE